MSNDIIASLKSELANIQTGVDDDTRAVAGGGVIKAWQKLLNIVDSGDQVTKDGIFSITRLKFRKTHTPTIIYL